MDIDNFKHKHIKRRSFGDASPEPKKFSIPIFKEHPLKKIGGGGSLEAVKQPIECDSSDASKKILNYNTSDISNWATFSSSIRRILNTYESVSIMSITRDIMSKYESKEYKKLNTQDYKTLTMINGTDGLDAGHFSMRILAKDKDISPTSRYYMIENMATSTGLFLNDEEMEFFSAALEKMLLLDSMNLGDETTELTVEHETKEKKKNDNSPLFMCYDFIHGKTTDYRNSDIPTFRVRKELVQDSTGKKYTWLIHKVDTPEYIRFGSVMRHYMKRFSKVVPKLVHWSMHPLRKMT
jgi:hypothetical protein